MSSDPTTLKIDGLGAGYGSMQAVTDFSVSVSSGEMVSVIGRNGAGKTTSLLAVAGLRYGRTTGSVHLGDRDLSSATPADIVRAGVVHIPEGHQIFRAMSVRENLRLGAYVNRRIGAKRIEENLEKVVELFPILGRYADRNAGFLSGGEQQMVAIGQGVMAEPKVLMLDEPTSGLALPVIRNILEAMDKICSEGVAVLFVEQSVQRALENSDRTYVMERGRIAMSGPSTELAGQDEVYALIRGTYTSTPVA